MKTMRMTAAIAVIGLAAAAGRAQDGDRVKRLGERERKGGLAEQARERREKLEAQHAEQVEARNAEMEARKAEWEARRAAAEKERAELERKRAELGAPAKSGDAPHAEIENRRAELEARRVELEKQRAEWEEKKADLERKRADAEERRKTMEEKRDEEKARIEERRRNVEEKDGGRVDERQENQAKRIAHGVRRGFLTPEETAALRDQQKAIADLEDTFKEDGRLTRTEVAHLRDALNTASRMIWAEKHDTEGRQMPVYRLGRNVFALDSLTARLSDPELSRSEARALLADFRRLLNLRDRLANEDLAEEQRAELQEAYNTLLGQYYRVG